MGKIGKALGYDMPEEEDSEDVPDKEPDNKAEVRAMKKFMAADTAEAKTEALKTFLELCSY